MKPIVPPPPPGPYPLRYNPLPDHTQLPDREGGKPLRPPPGPPPDHTTLPDKDGTFVRNSFEYWQSHLLSDSILPVADRLFPQGNYFIGEDCGIYWRLTEPPDQGVKAPDWFFVPNVPRLLDGQMRRSYVLWREVVSPLLVLEYVSDNGAENAIRRPSRANSGSTRKRSDPRTTAFTSRTCAAWKCTPRARALHADGSERAGPFPGARVGRGVGRLGWELRPV